MRVQVSPDSLSVCVMVWFNWFRMLTLLWLYVYVIDGVVSSYQPVATGRVTS
jgi:hypothetical protein